MDSKVVLPLVPNVEKAKKKNYYVQLNDRLRSLRKAHGKTLREMAEFVGVSISTYAGYEASSNNNNYRVPALDKIMRLAEFFGVSVDYLIGACDVKPRYVNLDIYELAKKTPLPPHEAMMFDALLKKVSDHILETSAV